MGRVTKGCLNKCWNRVFAHAASRIRKLGRRARGGGEARTADDRAGNGVCVEAVGWAVEGLCKSGSLHMVGIEEVGKLNICRIVRIECDLFKF